MTGTITIERGAIVRKAQFVGGKEATDGSYRILVRWFLEQSTSDGPRTMLPEVRIRGTQVEWDRFRLDLFALKNGVRHYFDPDSGDFDAAQPVPVTVEPAVHARLRPGALPLSIGDEELVCLQPGGQDRRIINGKIEQEDQTPLNPTRLPLSVRDILYEADPRAARGAVLAAIEKALTTARRAMEKEGISLLDFASGDDTARSAQATLDAWLQQETESVHVRRLARSCLTDDGLFDPLGVVAKLIDKRKNLALRLEGRAGPMTAETIAQIADTVLLTRALALADHSDRSGIDFLEALDDEQKQRLTAREALMASTAHGGRWLVYQNIPTDRELDSPTGQAFAPELVGLGWISKPIPAATAEGWATRFDAIDVEVTHEPLPPINFAGTRFVDEAEGGRVFAPGDRQTAQMQTAGAAIPARELRAIAQGSTRPVRPPTQAALFLGQVEAAPQTPEDGSVRQWQTPTNDTLVRLHLRGEGIAENRATDFRPAAGFSVYAVGRKPGDTSRHAPDISALRPWRINQRYSFLTDLFHAFGLDADPAARPEALVAAMDWPPEDPLIPRLAFDDNDTAVATALQAGEKQIIEQDTVLMSPYDLGDDTNDLGHASDTWLSFDLRQATATIAGTAFANFQTAREALGVRWDPNHPIDPKLDGTELITRGFDSYRFFVTTTDLYGQESGAIAVDCRRDFFDPGNTENLADGDYRPRQRRRIGAPPRRKGAPSDDGQIGADTPLLTFVTGRGSPGARIDLTWETPLREVAGVGGTAIPEPEHADQLEAEVRIYRRFIAGTGYVPEPAGPLVAESEVDAIDRENRLEGFDHFHSAEREKPDSDSKWRYKHELTAADHGYEYRAAIRFVLNKEARPAFFPDESRRWFHAIKDNALCSWQSPEIIVSGRFAQTNSAPALDPERMPMDPGGVAGAFKEMKQIGSAGAVSRDLVLTKLLSRSVDGLQPKAWPQDDAWKDARFIVTAAQAAVLEAALDRAGGTIADPRWHPFIRVLAQEFASVDPAAKEPPPSGNGIGPLAESDPLSDAIKLHAIIGLRGFVRLAWDASVVTDTHPPACEYVLVLKRVRTQGEGKEPLVDETEILILAADPGRTRYEVVLPVPGGLLETLTWSVTARTSAHASSRAVELFEETFSPSLAPPKVTGFDSSNKDIPALSLADRKYLPKFEPNPSDETLAAILKQAPRLKLEWTFLEALEGYGIALTKHRETWVRGVPRALVARGPSLAEILTEIAALGPSGKIVPGHLVAISAWLEGSVDASQPAGIGKFFFGTQGDTIPHEGLLRQGGKAVFVDYFHALVADDPDEEGPMDLAYGYAYAAAHFLKLSDGRVLMSEFTPLTRSLAPRPPELVLTAHAPTSAEIAGPLPRLTLRIGLDDRRPPALQGGALAIHVKALRAMKDTPVPGAALVTHRVPLGAPVVLGAGGSEQATIEAGELLRTGAHDPLDMVLEIHADLFLALDGRREPLAQGKQPRLITLTIPVPTGSGERELEQMIDLHLGAAPGSAA